MPTPATAQSSSTPSDGYCWLALVPSGTARFRRLYPPHLSRYHVGKLISRYGGLRRLSYTVETVDGIRFFHVFPGDEVTLEEFWALMDHDSCVGVDASMAFEHLTLFLVPHSEPASPGGSEDSFSLDNLPLHPALSDYIDSDLEVASRQVVWERIIHLSQNSSAFALRELDYMRFRKDGGRKYDAQFSDLIQGPGAVIMPKASSQYFRARTTWIEYRILFVMRQHYGTISRRAWQAIVDAIGGFCYVPALLTTWNEDRPEILARTYGPVISRSDLYWLVCERGLGGTQIGHYPPYDKADGTRVAGHFSVHEVDGSHGRAYNRYTFKELLATHILNSDCWE